MQLFYLIYIISSGESNSNIMKRKSSTNLNKINWSLCCICQKSSSVKLRSEKESVAELARRLAVFWQNNVLNIKPKLLTDNYNDDGTPVFLTPILQNDAKYHKDCYSKYTEYKLNKKLKSKSKETKKDNLANTSSSLRSSTAPLISQIICYICGQEDELCNLHAAGAWHASREKLKFDHVEKLTALWRQMATVLDKKELLSRLVIGDLGANSILSQKLLHTFP